MESNQKNGGFLTPWLEKNLADRAYEKRKSACSEVEQIFNRMALRCEYESIKNAISEIVVSLIDNKQTMQKKGGLGAIAAATIGLGKSAYTYKDTVMVPLLNCLNEPDSKLRYAACEALYNVVKVLRHHSMDYFPDLFHYLIKMAVDSDIDVKNGSDIVNKLLIDIVIEVPQLDVNMIKDVIREHLYVIKAPCRQFLITWLLIFHSKNGFDTIQCLPYWMDGILIIYSDKATDIRRQMGTYLAEVLKTLEDAWNNKHPINNHNRDLSLLIPILISNLQLTTNENTHIKLMDLKWIDMILKICTYDLITLLSNLIKVVIPHINDPTNENISKCASSINSQLLKLVKENDININWSRLTSSLMIFIDEANNTENFDIDCCQEALYWFNFLMETNFIHVYSNAENLFSIVLNLIYSEYDNIAIHAIKILYKFCLNDNNEEHYKKYFDSLIKNILLKFISNEYSDERKQFVVSELCAEFKPEDIFSKISEILLDLHHQNNLSTEDLSNMIYLFNTILFTCKKLTTLREKLFSLNNQNNCDLFSKLYKCWSYNPISTLTLCFMAQTYEHASHIIRLFHFIEIDLNVLLQIDHLVHLIESPVFSKLRLHLLDNQHQPYILFCLHGLLMLLPQSSTFEILSRRLKLIMLSGNIYSSINKQWAERHIATKHPSADYINFDELLKHFSSIHVKK